MAKSLYVVSSNEFSGKTAVCLGLALRFKKAGLKVSYFKPIAPAISTIRAGHPHDDDAQLMIDTLGLPYPLTTAVAGFLERRYLDKVSPEYRENLMNKIDKSFKEVSKDADVVIVEGCRRFRDGIALGLDPTSLAKRLGSKMLIVCKGGEDTVADKIIIEKMVTDSNEVDLMGCVVNNVPRTMIERVEGVVRPILESKGVNILGVIPEETGLTAPSVADIQAALQGEVLAGEENFDRMVRQILVGAMTPSSALRFLRSAEDKVVVTGGDRADIALLALETDTSLLVLTGNMYPDVHVISKAKEKKVPVILVPEDTYATVSKIESVTGRIKPGDQKKISFAEQIVTNFVDWKRILQTLGVEL
ncbi:MAG: phosphotransacetylase family protein [Promethearchaeati archaeon SRVP18_Atabeyarchaeia-1]